MRVVEPAQRRWLGMGIVIGAGLGMTGCASSPVQWTSVAAYAPVSQATAVGVNGAGASWFFQCDQRNVASGLRLPKFQGAEGSTQSITIKFDGEPEERSDWRLEQGALMLRGEAARLLSRRAALAYHAVVTIDGQPNKFALSGSHQAMIDLLPTCPQLEIPH